MPRIRGGVTLAPTVMRTSIAAAPLLLAACATLPPLRPADPTQAVPGERSAATAFAAGIRIVARPGAPPGSGDLEEVVTPVEIAIRNDSGRTLRVRPRDFTLLAPDGFRHEALAREDLRNLVGPYRGAAYGASYYWAQPWGFHPWIGPYAGWWGWGHGPGPAWIWVPHSAYGGVPTRALAQGTLEPGGSASILLFFPVPASGLDAFTLDATLLDASGQEVAALRVPFAREGRRPSVAPLPPTAAPPGGEWQTTPPP